MSDEERHDEEELRQARALAESFVHTRKGAADAAAAGVEDAFDAAELIAASRRPGLSAERTDAVLEAAWAKVDAERGRGWRRFVAIGAAAVGAGALAVAAAALLVFGAEPTSEPVGQIPVPTLFDARAEVERVQRAWLEAPNAQLTVELDVRLAVYRRTHLRAIEASLAP